MLNRLRKRRPPQHQVRDVLLSTVQVLLEGAQYKVPLDKISVHKRQPNNIEC